MEQKDNSQQNEPKAALNEEEMTFEQFFVYSARCNEIADVQEMIDVTGPPLDLNYRDDTMSMNTALHMAAGNGYDEIVKLILK